MIFPSMAVVMVINSVVVGGDGDGDGVFLLLLMLLLLLLWFF